MRHVPPPAVRGGLWPRLASLFFGLFVCALGVVLILQSGLGLSPWDVLHQGIARHTPLSFGVASIVVGLAVVLLARWLGARIGFGTLANAACIGAFIDLLLGVGAVPDAAGGALATRVAFLVAGIVAFGVGSAFYIGAGMGAGPRDSLMLIAAWRARTRIGAARAGLELVALAAGFALGGDVGVGTLAFAVFIGPAVEVSFLALARSPLARPRGHAVRAPGGLPRSPGAFGTRA